MRRISTIIGALLAAMLTATCAVHPAPNAAPQCAGISFNLSTAQPLCAA